MINRQGERRRIQRIRTSQPIIARIGSKRVAVIDLSLTGAKVAHEDAIGRVTESCVLEFDWEGQKIALRCEIRRTQIQRSANPAASRTMFHSGLLFVEGLGDSGRALRRYVEHQVIRAIEERKSGAASASVPLPDQVGHPASTLIRHDLETNSWKTAANAPQEVGFTIAS
jgi:hypothetical protein